VLEQLELDDVQFLTTERLAELLRQAGVQTAARTVAHRLRARGWLLPTATRGVWEFAPAALAGPYSRTGPTASLRAALTRRDIRCGLTFQAAAWALGLADRVPARLEVAAATRHDAARLPDDLNVSIFAPHLPMQTAKGVPVLQPASVLVHMAVMPVRVRSWGSALEWLPDLAGECEPGAVLAEVRGRPATVLARIGYLLQSLRPDIARELAPAGTKTWFGPRKPLLRHDNRWQIADTILPFDPRTLTAVR
jgi:transcriptional regulator with AbiEi antitoxin domain of type IV toxin-antitoxin system